MNTKWIFLVSLLAVSVMTHDSGAESNRSAAATAAGSGLLLPRDLTMILESLDQASPRAISRRMDIEMSEEYQKVLRARRLPSVYADIQFNTTAEDREDFDEIIWRARPFNRISVSQPIYHWNALLRGQQVAELQAEFSRLNYLMDLRRLKQEVRHLFFRILEAELARGIAEARVESDRRLVQEREQNLQLGRASSESYLEAVSRFQNDQNRLYEATKQVAYVRSQLRLRSGISTPVLTDPEETAQTLLVAPLPDWARTLPADEELTNEEMLRYENLAEQSSKQRDIHRSRTRPKLNFLVSAFQDEVNQRNDSEGITRTNLYFGVRVIWDIFDGWEADALVRREDIKKRQMEFERDQAKNELLDTIELLLQDLEFARQAIDNRRTQLEYLDDRYAKYEQEVAQGRRTQDDLFNIKISRDQGQFALVQAYTDFYLLYTELEDLLNGTERLAGFLQG